MFKKVFTVAGAIMSLLVLVVLALPTIVHSLGIRPVFDDALEYSLPGKRALLITTNHAVLNAPGETTGRPTSVIASEFTIAYYQFLDAGMDVEIASIKVAASNGLEFALTNQRRRVPDRTKQTEIKDSDPLNFNWIAI